MRALIRLMMFLCSLAAISVAVVACPSGTGGNCTKNEECTGGQICKYGKCTTTSNVENVGDTDGDGGGSDTPPPKPCTDDFDCPEDKRCANKVCADYPTSCTKNEECGLGRSCVGGKCGITACESDVQCSTGTVCDLATKRCKKTKTCEKSEDDCGSGMVCDSCRKVCTAKPTGAVCNEDFNCDIDKEFCDKCVRACKTRKAPCQPCLESRECGEEKDLCAPSQSGQRYCAVACQSGAFCPSGYKCEEVDHPDQSGQKVKLCFPASGNCASPGECSSSADCKGSQICDPKSKTCIAGCKDNAECTEGKKCCRGRCTAPCASNSQCQGQETCTGGCCKLDGECETSKDCPDKNYCNPQTGLCTPGCLLASDCGLPDPQKSRCRFLCENKSCVEDCRCTDQQLDCGPIRFCPKDDNNPAEIKPCRKPEGPTCIRCQADADCGCKQGDDCKFVCTRKACQADADCAGMPNGATSCYNQRCSTKQVCNTDAECPAGEKCENKKCGENCNNRCLDLGQAGKRCFTGCDPKGDGKECASRLSCVELLPQEAQGPKCEFDGKKRCKVDADCSGNTPRCGPDGYCSSCPSGQICRGFNKLDPLDLICIAAPPTMCADFTGAICEMGGF